MPGLIEISHLLNRLYKF